MPATKTVHRLTFCIYLLRHAVHSIKNTSFLKFVLLKSIINDAKIYTMYKSKN